MLVEAIVLGIAMAMYVGAEWTAEDTLEKQIQKDLKNTYTLKKIRR